MQPAIAGDLSALPQWQTARRRFNVWQESARKGRILRSRTTVASSACESTYIEAFAALGSA
jgi:hypothetical protein